jgi:hypothetical protein
MRSTSALVILAALLALAASAGAPNSTWTTLPIPRDATHVKRRAIQSEVPPYRRWVRTTFQLRRTYPNAEFVVDLDKALGPAWQYYGRGKEAWHVYVQNDRELRIRAGNWCNPSLRRTMSVVIEYAYAIASDQSRRDAKHQTVTVFEAEHDDACGYLESGELEPYAIRPGG